METTQTSTVASIESRSGWRKTDTMWMLGLYGTAIGAGVLFLPINAGVGGLIPLIIMAIIAFPMTFFAHRGLTRFVLSGKNPGEDITEVVEEHFGVGAGKLITLLYFFAIYPILLVYSVAITNTVDSFMTHQLGMTPPPRAILSLILIVGMMTIVRFGEQMIVKAMSVLVFPFVIALMVLAVLPDPTVERRRAGNPVAEQRIRDRQRPADDPVAGDPGDGVLLQPLADHLLFRRCQT